MSTTNPEISVIPKTPAEVAKAITYIALTALSLVVAVQQGSANHAVSLAAGLSIALQVIALVPIYLFAGTAVKTGIAAISAAGSILIQLFVGGYHPLTLADYVSLAIAVAATFGVALVPNKPMTPATPAVVGVSRGTVGQ